MAAQPTRTVVGGIEKLEARPRARRSETLASDTVTSRSSSTHGSGEGNDPQPDDRARRHQPMSWQDTDIGRERHTVELQSDGAVGVQRPGTRDIGPQVLERLGVGEPQLGRHLAR